MRTPSSVRELQVGQSAVLGEPTVPSALRARLAELGLRAGQEVLLLQRAVGGARVVAVAGSRIALDGPTAGGLPVTTVGEATR